MSQSIVGIGSVVLFALGVGVALAIVARFNIATRRFVGDIQRIAHREGKDWKFWNEPDRLLMFLFRPGNLIDENDSEAVQQAKMALVSHRRTLPKKAAWAALSLVAGVAMAAAIPVIAAYLQQKG